MIVECSNCSTRFQLDDSRVPLSGIRVRCSRCKEAFFLKHPDASEADALDDVAARATSAARISVDASTDLVSNVQVSAPEADDEDDWEFNQDPGADDPGDSFEADSDESDEDPISEVDMQVPGLGIDDSPEAAEAEESDSGLDLAGESAQTSDGVDFDAGDDASDFGEAGDFSALAEELEDEEDESAAALAEPVAAAPAAQRAPDMEDVGEPEDWDFFSDESLEEPGRVQPLDRAVGRAMAAVEADYPARATRPAPDLAKSSRGGRLGAGVAQAGRLVGWSVTLMLFAVGIGRGVFQIDAAGAARRATSVLVAFDAFQAEEISASWIDTVRPNRLYSVRGRLKNTDGRTRMAGPGLQVTLLSGSGARLDGFAAAAGVPLREDWIRELAPEPFAETAAGATSALAATRLAPGESLAFEALFDGVPDAAASFVVEMTGMPPLAPFEPDPAHLDQEPRISPSGPASPDPASAGPPSPTGDPSAPRASG